jgi:hypothetical protein
VIKFCFKLNGNATKNNEKLKIFYGEHALSREHGFRRHKAFLDAHECVEDETLLEELAREKRTNMYPN